MEIRYDATDWKNHYEQSAARPTTLDDAIDLMRESNIKPGELAVLLIVGRELGIVKDPNLPSNKMSNLTGTALAVSRYRSRQRAQVTIAGKKTSVQRFVSTVTIEEGEQAAYQMTTPSIDVDVTTVDYNSDAAAERAISYLMTNVVGRIRDRLSLVALNRPKELAKVVRDLKAAIDEIVKELK